MRGRSMTVLTCALLLLVGAGCDDAVSPGGGGGRPDDPAAVSIEGTVAEALAENLPDHEEPGDAAWETPAATRIVLSGYGIAV